MSDKTTSTKKDSSILLLSIRFRIMLSLILKIICLIVGYDFFRSLDEDYYYKIASYFMDTALPLIVTYLALLNAFVPPKGLTNDLITKNHFFMETYLLLGLTGFIPFFVSIFGSNIDIMDFEYDPWGGCLHIFFWSVLLFYCLSVIRNFVFLYNIHCNAWSSSE